MRRTVPVVHPVSERMFGCLVDGFGLRCSASCACEGSDALGGMRCGSGFPTVVPGVILGLGLAALASVRMRRTVPVVYPVPELMLGCLVNGFGLLGTADRAGIGDHAFLGVGRLFGDDTRIPVVRIFRARFHRGSDHQNGLRIAADLFQIVNLEIRPKLSFAVVTVDFLGRLLPGVGVKELLLPLSYDKVIGRVVKQIDFISGSGEQHGGIRVLWHKSALFHLIETNGHQSALSADDHGLFPGRIELVGSPHGHERIIVGCLHGIIQRQFSGKQLIDFPALSPATDIPAVEDRIGILLIPLGAEMDDRSCGFLQSHVRGRILLVVCPIDKTAVVHRHIPVIGLRTVFCNKDSVFGKDHRIGNRNRVAILILPMIELHPFHIIRIQIDGGNVSKRIIGQFLACISRGNEIAAFHPDMNRSLNRLFHRPDDGQVGQRILEGVDQDDRRVGKHFILARLPVVNLPADKLLCIILDLISGPCQLYLTAVSLTLAGRNRIDLGKIVIVNLIGLDRAPHKHPVPDRLFWLRQGEAVESVPVLVGKEGVQVGLDLSLIEIRFLIPGLKLFKFLGCQDFPAVLNEHPGGISGRRNDFRESHTGFQIHGQVVNRLVPIPVGRDPAFVIADVGQRVDIFLVVMELLLGCIFQRLTALIGQDVSFRVRLILVSRSSVLFVFVNLSIVIGDVKPAGVPFICNLPFLKVLFQLTVVHQETLGILVNRNEHVVVRVGPVVPEGNQNRAAAAHGIGAAARIQ